MVEVRRFMALSQLLNHLQIGRRPLRRRHHPARNRQLQLCQVAAGQVIADIGRSQPQLSVQNFHCNSKTRPLRISRASRLGRRLKRPGKAVDADDLLVAVPGYPSHATENKRVSKSPPPASDWLRVLKPR